MKTLKLIQLCDLSKDTQQKIKTKIDYTWVKYDGTPTFNKKINI